MKLNIHLTVDAGAAAWAAEVNAGIRAIAPSDIVLGPGSPMSPHVTLVMGELEAPGLLTEIEARLRAAFADRPRIVSRIAVPAVVRVPDYLGYVDGDAVMDGSVRLRRERLVQSLRDVPGWTMREGVWRPHLTVAKVDDRIDAVDAWLRTVRADFLCAHPEAAIAERGPRGTCVRTLHAVPLG